MRFRHCAQQVKCNSISFGEDYHQEAVKTKVWEKIKPRTGHQLFGTDTTLSGPLVPAFSSLFQFCGYHYTEVIGLIYVQMTTTMRMLAVAFVAVLLTTEILWPMNLDFCALSFGEAFYGIFLQTNAIMSCGSVHAHRMVDMAANVMFMVATTFASTFYTTLSLAYQQEWVATRYHYLVKHLFAYLLILVALGDLPHAHGIETKKGNHESVRMWLVHSISIKRWMFVLILLATLIIGAFIWILVVKLYKWSLRTSALPREEIIFLESLTVLPPKFSYHQLQLATIDFSKELGRGGFGVVYEGNLDGTKIAVKRLQGSGRGQQQYRVELASLGSIHHQNIIRLYGFCFEGVQRLLVYEFMVNGSLDQWLFDDKFLPWAIRFQIVVDIATALCYLHKDCTKRIIHFDVKPHNILLDNQFRAKIADFGMSMLCNKEEIQVMAHMRGTKGYYAPDWLKHFPITEKCDVYSFGRMLLEIVGGRKNIDGNLGLERWFFPSLVVNKINDEGGCRDITDTRLRDLLTIDDWDQVYRTIKIALWCINDNPSCRPSMEQVIFMLKGAVDVDDPPLTFDFLLEGDY